MNVKKAKVDSLDDEWFVFGQCMNCGRETLPSDKEYTVKYRTRRKPAIVCKACANKPDVMLRTPYISFDMFYSINVEVNRR